MFPVDIVDSKNSVGSQRKIGIDQSLARPTASKKEINSSLGMGCQLKKEWATTQPLWAGCPVLFFHPSQEELSTTHTIKHFCSLVVPPAASVCSPNDFFYLVFLVAFFSFPFPFFPFACGGLNACTYLGFRSGGAAGRGEADLNTFANSDSVRQAWFRLIFPEMFAQ